MRMKLFIAGLLLVFAAGPAYPQNKDILQLQRDMIEVQQRVKQVQTTVDQDNAVIKGLAEKLTDQVGTVSGGLQKVTQTVDGIKTQNDATTREMRTILTSLSATMKELQEEMSAVRAQVTSVSRELTAMKTTAAPLAGPNDLWREASLDYLTASYDLAITGLQEYLSKYPNDVHAVDAHLLLGDVWVSQKKFEQAIFEYDIVLQKFPESDKTRTALLKKGLAQAETNQPQASTTLNEVVKKFPGTSEATRANEKLKEIQIPARRPPAR